MICAFLLFSLIGMSVAQRSPYLSSQAVDYPGVLSRFRPNASAAESGSNSSDSGLDRFGGGSQPVVNNYDGTLYDKETVDRVAQLPREKQPYWYINRQHISGHVGSRVQPNRTN